MPVFVVATAAVTALMLLGYNEGALPWVLLVGTYTVAAHRPVREAVAATALVAVLLVVILLADVPRFGPGELLTGFAAFVAATLLGTASQSRQHRLDALERRTARRPRCGPRPTNDCASPKSCTTSSRTRSA